MKKNKRNRPSGVFNMSDKIVFYFHGYGSSPLTDKVLTLKENFENVYAFPIDLNPDVSLPYLIEAIYDTILSKHLNDNREIVFIGTSLGAWYAGRMACAFSYAKCVLINPAYSFDDVKVDLPISEEVKTRYKNLGFIFPTHNTTFFIAENDEVIDFSNLKTGKSRRINNPNADHRFNGEPFEEVIQFVKNLEDF